mmetsp:Transcript_14938/g.23270  ORF Transcript_14938/g.23270 Transcript_14938/m.23270 type:complete len:117 (+) Transcript_14938:101-451(+)
MFEFIVQAHHLLSHGPQLQKLEGISAFKANAIWDEHVGPATQVAVADAIADVTANDDLSDSQKRSIVCMMPHFDLDKDGEIAKSEFVGLISSNAERGRQLSPAEVDAVRHCGIAEP